MFIHQQELFCFQEPKNWSNFADVSSSFHDQISQFDRQTAIIQKFFECYGYPANIIRCVIDSKIKRFEEPYVLVRSRCPIYLKLSWLGRMCQILSERMSDCIASCYNTVKLCTVSNRICVPFICKDHLSYFKKIFQLYTNSNADMKQCIQEETILGWKRRLRNMFPPICVHVAETKFEELQKKSTIHRLGRICWTDLIVPMTMTTHGFLFYVVLTRFTSSESLRLPI